MLNLTDSSESADYSLNGEALKTEYYKLTAQLSRRMRASHPAAARRQGGWAFLGSENNLCSAIKLFNDAIIFIFIRRVPWLITAQCYYPLFSCLGSCKHFPDCLN